MNNFLNPRILEFLLYLYFSIVLSHVMIIIYFQIRVMEKYESSIFDWMPGFNLFDFNKQCWLLQERLSIRRSITKTCRAGSSAVCWWWNKYPKITNHRPLDFFIIQHFSFIIILLAPISSDALAVIVIWDGNEAWSLWRWIIWSLPFITVSVLMTVSAVAGKVLHREEQICFNNF